MRETWLIAVVTMGLTASGLSASSAEQRFPDWDVGGRTLHATWLESSVVVIGDIANGREYGVQEVERMPWPVQQGLRYLHWCKGELHVTATIKGEGLGRSLQVFWASVQRGCAIESKDARQSRHLTKVWFARMQGPFTVLLNAHHYRRYLGLQVRWEGGSDLAARDWLGSILLTPGAEGATAGDFADRIWEQGDLACALLGRDKCVREITKTASRQIGPVRDAVCQYLLAQHGVKCDP
jgi:hypothetical protein